MFSNNASLFGGGYCMNNVPFKELTLAVVVVLSLVGLIGFSIFDPNSRSAFLDVAKVTIGAFIGYLIPNGK
jgi:hypothetical protein